MGQKETRLKVDNSQRFLSTLCGTTAATFDKRRHFEDFQMSPTKVRARGVLLERKFPPNISVGEITQSEKSSYLVVECSVPDIRTDSSITES
jgi:hypothetical protein